MIMWLDIKKCYPLNINLNILKDYIETLIVFHVHVHVINNDT